MLKLLKVTAHAAMTAISALGGMVVAILLMAFIPRGGPYGEGWIFGLEIALFFLLPILAGIGYLCVALPRETAIPNRTAESDAPKTGARGSP